MSDATAYADRLAEIRKAEQVINDLRWKMEDAKTPEDRRVAATEFSRALHKLGDIARKMAWREAFQGAIR